MAGRAEVIITGTDRSGPAILSAIRHQRMLAAQTMASGRVVERTTDRMHSSLSRFTRFLHQQLAGTVRSFFYGIRMGVVGAGAAVAAFLASGIKSFRDFDKQMRETTALIAGSGKKNLKGALVDVGAEYKKLYAQILRMAPTVRKTPQDLGAGLYELVQGGLSGKQAMRLLKPAAKGAAAGGGSVQSSSRVLLQIMNALKLGTTKKGADKQATMVMDQIFQAINLGVGVDFQGLTQGIGKFMGSAGVTFKGGRGKGNKAGPGIDTLKQLMATYVFATKQGARQSDVGVGIQDVIKTITHPSKSGKAFARDKLGLDLNSTFMNKHGFVGSLQLIIAKMKEAGYVGAKLNDAIGNIFGDVRGRRIAAYAANTKFVTQALKDQGLAVDAVSRSYDEQGKSLDAAMQTFKSYWETLKISLGGAAAPYVVKGMDAITHALGGAGVVGQGQELNDQFQALSGHAAKEKFRRGLGPEQSIQFHQARKYNASGLGGKLQQVGASALKNLSVWWNSPATQSKFALALHTMIQKSFALLGSTIKSIPSIYEFGRRMAGEVIRGAVDAFKDQASNMLGSLTHGLFGSSGSGGSPISAPGNMYQAVAGGAAGLLGLRAARGGRPGRAGIMTGLGGLMMGLPPGMAAMGGIGAAGAATKGRYPITGKVAGQLRFPRIAKWFGGGGDDPTGAASGPLAHLAGGAGAGGGAAAVGEMRVMASAVYVNGPVSGGGGGGRLGGANGLPIVAGGSGTGSMPRYISGGASPAALPFNIVSGKVGGRPAGHGPYTNHFQSQFTSPVKEGYSLTRTGDRVRFGPPGAYGKVKSDAVGLEPTQTFALRHAGMTDKDFLRTQTRFQKLQVLAAKIPATLAFGLPRAISTGLDIIENDKRVQALTGGLKKGGTAFQNNPQVVATKAGLKAGAKGLNKGLRSPAGRIGIAAGVSGAAAAATGGGWGTAIGTGLGTLGFLGGPELGVPLMMVGGALGGMVDTFMAGRKTDPMTNTINNFYKETGPPNKSPRGPKTGGRGQKFGAKAVAIPGGAGAKFGRGGGFDVAAFNANNMGGFKGGPVSKGGQYNQALLFAKELNIATRQPFEKEGSFTKHLEKAQYWAGNNETAMGLITSVYNGWTNAAKEYQAAAIAKKILDDDGNFHPRNGPQKRHGKWLHDKKGRPSKALLASTPSVGRPAPVRKDGKKALGGSVVHNLFQNMVNEAAVFNKPLQKAGFDPVAGTATSFMTGLNMGLEEAKRQAKPKLTSLMQAYSDNAIALAGGGGGAGPSSGAPPSPGTTGGFNNARDIGSRGVGAAESSVFGPAMMTAGGAMADKVSETIADSVAKKQMEGPVGKAQQGLRWLYQQVGKPYIWGGGHPPGLDLAGYDCSGLASSALMAMGSKLSGTTFNMIGNTAPGAGLVQLGFNPATNPHHMGISVMGKWFEAAHTGAPIRGPGDARSNWPYVGAPKFHSGGVYRANTLRGEGPAILKDGEMVVRPSSDGGLQAHPVSGGSGLTINGPLIGHANIRSDHDIHRVAQELVTLLQKKKVNSGRGGA